MASLGISIQCVWNICRNSTATDETLLNRHIQTFYSLALYLNRIALVSWWNSYEMCVCVFNTILITMMVWFDWRIRISIKIQLNLMCVWIMNSMIYIFINYEFPLKLNPFAIHEFNSSSSLSLSSVSVDLQFCKLHTFVVDTKKIHSKCKSNVNLLNCNHSMTWKLH